MSTSHQAQRSHSPWSSVSLSLAIGRHRFAGVGPTVGNLALAERCLRFKQFVGAALCLLPFSISARRLVLAYLPGSGRSYPRRLRLSPPGSALPFQSRCSPCPAYMDVVRRNPRQDRGPSATAKTSRSHWEEPSPGARCCYPGVPIRSSLQIKQTPCLQFGLHQLAAHPLRSRQHRSRAADCAGIPWAACSPCATPSCNLSIGGSVVVIRSDSRTVRVLEDQGVPFVTVYHSMSAS